MESKPNTFLSWSGPKSHAVAKVFEKRLPRLIQACHTWMSSSDLTMGRPWRDELKKQLDDEHTVVGLFMLTKKNQHEPWLLFEYGRLSAKDYRLCPPLCCDFRPAEITGPLGDLNGATTSREDVLRLLQNIRSHIAPTLSDEVLSGVFEEMWPTMQAELQSALETQEDGGEKITVRDSHEMIAEVLELTRTIMNRTKPLPRDTHEFRPRSIYDDPPRFDEASVLAVDELPAEVRHAIREKVSFPAFKYVMGIDFHSDVYTVGWIDSCGRRNTTLVRRGGLSLLSSLDDDDSREAESSESSD